MAKQELMERPKYLRERENKRIFYAANNFQSYKPLSKTLLWLDRVFDLIPATSEGVNIVSEINQSIDKALSLAKSLEKKRTPSA